MVITEKHTIYKGFGFTIQSDFYLPELQVVDVNEEQVEVIIEKADLTTIWSETAKDDQYFVIKKNLTMFKVDDVAIYSIHEGNRICVSPLDGSVEDQVRLYILGSCMGALLMQRKILPLHGSAVVIDGKTYAIVGDAGAGKSTLAAAFLDRGYKLLSDDVIPVTLSVDRFPIVTPAYPQQKLWREGLNRFGIDSDQLRPIYNRESKFAVPILSQFATGQFPLAGVFELIKIDHDAISLQPIRGLARLDTLFNHTYRNYFIKSSGLMAWHFTTTTAIANKIDLYQLHRPECRFTANEIADLILEKIESGERES